jgi:uncharacterized lipoprotein YbaY
MKRVLCSLALGLVLVACATQAPEASSPAGPDLRVTSGDQTVTYTVAELQGLASAESSFKDVTYTGIPLPVLLADTGFAPDSLTAVKAVASDGFSVTYDPGIFQRQDVLVAWAQADGPLAAEDGVLRMVVPDGEGKMNVRMLVELQVVP